MLTYIHMKGICKSSLGTLRFILNIWFEITVYQSIYDFAWETCVSVFMTGPIKSSGRQPLKILSDMVQLGRPYHFKFFKGCIP